MNNPLKDVYDASLKFLVPLTPEETYSLIVKEAIKLVKADYGSIFIEQNGTLKRVFASSPLFFKIKPRKNGITYQVFKTQKPAILDSSDVGKIHPAFYQTKARSDLIFPLHYKNQSIGVLSVQSVKPKFFKETKIDTLALFSPLATLAIKKTQLYAETKDALDTRDIFISMAAHELRTPLTSVNGYAQLLYNKLIKKSNSEARWAEQLLGESVRLSYLINEFLEVHRIRSGKLQYLLKECNLQKILDRTVNDHNISYPHRKLIFTSNIDNQAIVVADFDKLIQVFINLLENAVKFSTEDKPIYFTVQAKKPFYEFLITDQGIGIPNSEIPRVFEGLAGGLNNIKEGIGIGLFLAKNIIENHQGSIEIKSKLKKGTTVKVKLPMIKR